MFILKVGTDQVNNLQVNGVNLCSATHEEAASILKHSASFVDMTVIYNPEGIIM